MANPAPTGLNRFYLILGAVAVVGVAALVFLMRSGPVSIPANVVVQASDTLGFRGYVVGQAAAPVEIVEYADYQCPACANFETVQWPTIKERLVDSGRIRWVYRDFPLDMHRHARVASHAAACAEDQGRFWEFKRGIYDTQNEWAFARDAAGHFRTLAKSFGLDIARYDDCMTSAKYAGRIQASFNEGAKAGVNATPSFIIGGRIYGSMPYDQLKAMVDSLAAATSPQAALR